MRCSDHVLVHDDKNKQLRVFKDTWWGDYSEALPAEASLGYKLADGSLMIFTDSSHKAQFKVWNEKTAAWK